jgi:MFS family permease
MTASSSESAAAGAQAPAGGLAGVQGPQVAADVEAPSPVPGVTRNVFLLGVVSFVADIASEMAYPLIPVFLTSTLGAPVAAMGAIEGVAEGTASSLKVASGWLSDRVGRRKGLVTAGYALSALGKALLALAFAWPQVFAARFVDRFGKGVRTSPRDALIADGTPASLLGRAFGFHRALDTAGAVVGPLIALLLVGGLSLGIRTVLLVAVVPGVASVALLLVLVRDIPVKGAVRAEAGDPPARAPGAYWAFLAVVLVFAIGNSSDTFLILRAKDVGLSLSLVVVAYVSFNVSYTLLSMPAGVVSDRVDRRLLYTLGLVIFGLVYLGFAWLPSTAWVWPLFVVYGCYMALTEGTGRALVAEVAPSGRRGTFLGLYHTSVGLAAVLASVMAGLLWQTVAPAAPFAVGAGMAFASAALMLLLVAMGPRLGAAGAPLPPE